MTCNHNGKCSCNDNVSGDKCSTCSTGYDEFPACDKCVAEYYGYPTCKSNKINSVACNFKSYTPLVLGV